MLHLISLEASLVFRKINYNEQRTNICRWAFIQGQGVFGGGGGGGGGGGVNYMGGGGGGEIEN